MNKKNLEILGLNEGATAEEIEQAYSTLKAKYMEERFLDGEAGNNAAKMLGKIETARDELIAELNEAVKNEDGTATETGDAYAKVEQLIKDGNLQEAQRALDGFNERNAEWHYLQSVVFYRKNWVNESKKQLEIAMRLDAGNDKYKEAYKKLSDKIDYDANKNNRDNGGSVYQGQDMSYPGDNQMGDFCASCAECCALNACLNCMCNGCCR